MASAQIQFRDEELDKRFAERASATPLMVRAKAEKLTNPEDRKEEERERSRLFSYIGERDLERYYKAVDATLYAINLSYGDAMLIIDALNGYLMTPELPQLLVHNVRDAIQMDHLDAKWDVDGADLIRKLDQLTPIDCLAINDGVERWWNTSAYYTDEESETHEQRCVRVGLIRPPRRPLSPDTSIDQE